MGCQRITPEMEAVIGARLRASALADGHRPKLPVGRSGGTRYTQGSQNYHTIKLLKRDGVVTARDLSRDLGVTGHRASVLLSLLRSDGKIEVCGERRGPTGQRMNVYKLAVAI